MQLAVGQGDLLTDPLQMAVAYSALANAYTHEGHGWVPGRIWAWRSTIRAARWCRR